MVCQIGKIFVALDCDYYNNVLQLVTTVKETFVWWEDLIAGRVEWSYICLEFGALLLQPTF